MPTIIMLDVSLSMCRTVQNSKCPVEIRQLAAIGIGSLLDYFAQNAQLENAAFLIFSSLWELKQNFTRHHENIKNMIYDLELYDKSNIVNAFRGLLTLKLNETCQNRPLNIILITDGLINSSCYQIEATRSRNEDAETDEQSTDDCSDVSLDQLENAFDFPCKLQVVCLAAQSEPALKYSIPFYKRLITTVDSATHDPPVITGTNNKQSKRSAIWLPETNPSELTVESAEKLFNYIADLHYKPYHAMLNCGNLSSLVMLSPKPSEYCVEPLKNKFDAINTKKGETFVIITAKSRIYKLLDRLTICGFLPVAEVASPAIVSRHLILPIPCNKNNETAKAEQILSQDSSVYNNSIQARNSNGIGETTLTKTQPSTSLDSYNSEQDLNKQPSFCIMLHTCLKQENMVAICLVGKNEELDDDWFGMIHSQTDSKKRTNLMLSFFKPGPGPIPWLPNFRHMTSKALLATVERTGESNEANSDPVKIERPLKSYSSNTAIWLNSESVQADLYKVIRNARRLPERQSTFMKEMTRVHQAARSYGFHDVLYGLASMLEREKEIAKTDPAKYSSQFLSNIDEIIDSLRVDLSASQDNH